MRLGQVLGQSFGQRPDQGIGIRPLRSARPQNPPQQHGNIGLFAMEQSVFPTLFVGFDELISLADALERLGVSLRREFPNLAQIGFLDCLVAGVLLDIQHFVRGFHGLS